MLEGFSGQTVVVTGAGGGIGRELCRLFHTEGARVVAIDIDPASLVDLDGVKPVDCLAVDLTDREATEGVFLSIGPVDVLVNNAGVTALGPYAAIPGDAFEQVLAVNLLGSANATRASLEGLVQRRGRIAVMSSVAGFAPLVNRTAYSASKHALHGLFGSLRAELAGSGVSITLVCPTFTDTGIETRAVARAPGEAGAWSTTGRHLTAVQVAAAVVGGLRRRTPLVLPGATAKLAYAVWRIHPGLYAWMMRRRVT